MEASQGIHQVLERAGIPSARWGTERLTLLAPGARELYRSILRSFANGRPPESENLARAAFAANVDLDSTLATLAAEDLVHADPASGKVMVAYPFSQPPTHRVRLDGEREVFAMCAIDALGVPFMLGVAAEIVSRDPVTGDEVWVRVEPGEGQWWEPEQAVVLAGSVPGPGPSSGTCCRFVNFFSSRDSAERYLADRPSLVGGILTIPDAAAAGRIVFGELLEEG